MGCSASIQAMIEGSWLVGAYVIMWQRLLSRDRDKLVLLNHSGDWELGFSVVCWCESARSAFG